MISYQTSDEDLAAMIETASVHLQSGGLFIFDFWYGPAVLWQRPEQRVKRWEDDTLLLTRVAEPVVRDHVNCVDVNYTIFIEDKDNGTISCIKETHAMRYLFLGELDRLLSNFNMTRVRAEEWMSGATVGPSTWGVCVVARKQ